MARWQWNLGRFNNYFKKLCRINCWFVTLGLFESVVENKFVTPFMSDICFYVKVLSDSFLCLDQEDFIQIWKCD